jgi:hypothetical protein
MVTTGFPDRPWILTETFRQFAAVIWYTGGSASANLKSAVGVIPEYLYPTDGHPVPGRMLLASQKIVGSQTNLPFAFIQGELGISPTAAPANYFFVPAGQQALGQQDHLVDIRAATSYGGGSGLQPLGGTEVLYQMEYCRTCYGNRPPFDPIVAVRKPDRITAPLASIVTITIQLEQFEPTTVFPALQAVMADELGVTLP